MRIFVLFAVMMLGLSFAEMSFAENIEIVVKKGDNFWKLAKRYNISHEVIIKLNKERLKDKNNPNLIFPGQKMEIPPGKKIVENVIEKPVEKKKVAARISSKEEVLAAMEQEKIITEATKIEKVDIVNALQHKQGNEERKLENKMIIMVLLGVLLIIGILCYQYPVFNFKKKIFGRGDRRQIFICIIRNDKGSQYCCIDGESIVIVDAMKMGQFILNRVGRDESRINFRLSMNLKSKIKKAGFEKANIILLENEARENFFKLIRPRPPRVA
ncbi:MAG: LysM peptidoglycan-binding domain-containing protein [bacterium]